MNIVYSTSESYAEPTAISMYSLLANNSCCKVLDLFVIESGLSNKSRQIITDIADSFSRFVVFINADKVFSQVVSDYNLELLRGGYSTYARVFINHFLPNIDRVILIDSDSLVLQSLHEFWEHDMNGAVIGAVPEIVVYGKRSFHEDPSLVNGCDYYYNMGMVLFDLQAWRDQNIDKILSDALTQKIPQKYLIADQSIINKHLSDRISRVSLKFNFYTFMHALPSKSVLDKLFKKQIFDYIEVKAASTSPAIVHFVGNWIERPWYRRGKSVYKEVYLLYRGMTPYKSQNLWEKPKESAFTNFLNEGIFIFYQLLPLNWYLIFRYDYLQRFKKLFKLSR
jgi:lipopolysaccharide biosynthesis glycosyltransferase